MSLLSQFLSIPGMLASAAVRAFLRFSLRRFPKSYGITVLVHDGDDASTDKIKSALGLIAAHRPSMLAGLQRRVDTIRISYFAPSTEYNPFRHTCHYDIKRVENSSPILLAINLVALATEGRIKRLGVTITDHNRARVERLTRNAQRAFLARIPRSEETEGLVRTLAVPHPDDQLWEAVRDQVAQILHHHGFQVTAETYGMSFGERRIEFRKHREAFELSWNSFDREFFLYRITGLLSRKRIAASAGVATIIENLTSTLGTTSSLKSARQSGAPRSHR